MLADQRPGYGTGAVNESDRDHGQRDMDAAFRRATELHRARANPPPRDIEDTPSDPIARTQTALKISSVWAVRVQGMNDVLPALGRCDAVERAHKANEGAVRLEANPGLEQWESVVPIVWAAPCQYGPGSPAGERCVYPTDWTAEQVEDVWAEWAE